MEATPPSGWPRKTREMQNHHMDSTRWNDFPIRDGDIVIATWAKSGTTWMQQIVAQLLADGAEQPGVLDASPWIEMRVIPLAHMLDAAARQTDRRCLKTHLPVDALVFAPQARYAYVARDGRDAYWSWHHHHASYTDWAYKGLNETPGLVGPPLAPPPEDIVEGFRNWLENDGAPVWPFFSNIRSWWEIRQLPNVLLLHFNDLKADLEGCIRRVAGFLEIPFSESRLPDIVEHCSFDYMKTHADTLSSRLERSMKGGARTFINQGTNGRWQAVLSATDSARYEAVAARELPPECARWLARGGSLADSGE